MKVVSPSSRSVEQGTLNTETRTGIIKEYIETEGLGILLSKEVGIVLFHLDSVWINGRLSLNRRIAKEKLYVGTDVEFIMRSFHGEEYFKVSEDSVVHQAVAVWTGDKPESVLKVALGEENTKKLEDNRRDFMLLAKGDNFMRQGWNSVQKCIGKGKKCTSIMYLSILGCSTPDEGFPHASPGRGGGILERLGRHTRIRRRG